MTHLTTHVLDSVCGEPAAGIAVTLAAAWTPLAHGATDSDGRLALGPDRLEPGEYSLTFRTGDYFAARGTASFHPSVTVTFTVDDSGRHLHVPLLLSPFAYSTYRGS
ncbi:MULTISPECIES: hydroxyisourate hydrolase [Microbacterium]|uniref:5-hydroxyisourate hydrolase n=1 Tax=Microbacterium wangchenii TaxID=2541726 RepID=A0ABX5SQ50_9MICO|nr:MULTISPECIES: hydroxyisourate hydrolase [Microbacterium]MCK6066333.1 hydroxyisourate hydrolase [Microbacterium sp. EYE_512]QBR87306.1 hydroxyisourate hydrolase [Microbacterium wangchenii]TXK14627.1 hydroxyisourate hydrolase [Microbacterium wangchenii]